MGKEARKGDAWRREGILATTETASGELMSSGEVHILQQPTKFKSRMKSTMVWRALQDLLHPGSLEFRERETIGIVAA